MTVLLRGRGKRLNWGLVAEVTYLVLTLLVVLGLLLQVVLLAFTDVGAWAGLGASFVSLGIMWACRP